MFPFSKLPPYNLVGVLHQEITSNNKFIIKGIFYLHFINFLSNSIFITLFRTWGELIEARID